MTSETELAQALEFARDAAVRAGRIAMEHYQNGVTVETKSDASPVTIADRRAEQELRGLIAERYPDDGVLGEEFGERPGKSGRRWILDPIDGTRSFVHGVPLFGVLIGLEERGQAVLGVVLLPALDEMMYAARGQGAWWLPSGRKAGEPPRRARVSSTPKLADGLMTISGVQYFDRVGKLPAYERVRRAAKTDRGWGDCYGHMLVATGRAEVMLDPVMNVWDCAALAPIVMEAGGTFTDWKGDFTIHGGNAISTNGKVFEETLRLIGS